MKTSLIIGTLSALAPLCLSAHSVCYKLHVVDSESGLALNGIPCETIFTTRTGNWNDMSHGRLEKGLTNASGDFKFSGASDVSHVTFSIRIEDGRYYPVIRQRIEFSGVSGVLNRHWEPYDSVVTVKLQRVEHPIPLFVKRVELRDYERGIGGFDGTNSVLRFDLVKGDWLPPYGQGETADVNISSRILRTGSEKRFLPQDGVWGELQFYDLVNNVGFRADDYVSQISAMCTDGIRIRMAPVNGVGNQVSKKMGKRKKFEHNKDWYCERFNDRDPDRCYTFRIRSRFDEKGKLVEAYYGKIYGDFEFEGDDKKGLIGVKFLYYLNPASLDRNLEWDMKTNLCPNPGDINQRQP